MCVSEVSERGARAEGGCQTMQWRNSNTSNSTDNTSNNSGNISNNSNSRTKA